MTETSSEHPADRLNLTSGGKKESRLFVAICLIATWSSVLMLVVLLTGVMIQSWGWLDGQFLTSYDSRRPANAGILGGALGSLWVILFTGIFSIPVGVGSAVYLEEYARDNWVTRLIRVNLANLAGVPSIVYGILGLTAFVRMFGLFGPGGYLDDWFGIKITELTLLSWPIEIVIPLPFDRVVVAGALTLTLLILPVVIIASQEALRAVPPSIRHASFALGATRWQTVRHQVIPAALPGILTGIILSISRAIGETAPLIVLGTAAYVNFAPGNLDSLHALWEDPSGIAKAPFDSFTVMPIQIYNWVGQFKPEFRENVSAAGIVTLLALLLILNGLAVMIRQYSRRHVRW